MNALKDELTEANLAQNLDNQPLPKKRKDSRDKGKRGERGWRNFLWHQGFTDAYRSQQFCGSNNSADVIDPSMPNIHYEVKIGMQVPKKIYDYVEQAKNDCGINTPVIALKRDRCEWLVVLRGEDYCSMAKGFSRPELIVCPDCKTEHVCKNGTTIKGRQKYRCLNEQCETFSFVLE